MRQCIKEDVENELLLTLAEKCFALTTEGGGDEGGSEPYDVSEQAQEM